MTAGLSVSIAIITAAIVSFFILFGLIFALARAANNTNIKRTNPSSPVPISFFAAKTSSSLTCTLSRTSVHSSASSFEARTGEDFVYDEPTSMPKFYSSDNDVVAYQTPLELDFPPNYIIHPTVADAPRVPNKSAALSVTKWQPHGGRRITRNPVVTAGLAPPAPAVLPPARPWFLAFSPSDWFGSRVQEAPLAAGTVYDSFALATYLEVGAAF